MGRSGDGHQRGTAESQSSPGFWDGEEEHLYPVWVMEAQGQTPTPPWRPGGGQERKGALSSDTIENPMDMVCLLVEEGTQTPCLLWSWCPLPCGVVERCGVLHPQTPARETVGLPWTGNCRGPAPEGVGHPRLSPQAGRREPLLRRGRAQSGPEAGVT